MTRALRAATGRIANTARVTATAVHTAPRVVRVMPTDTATASIGQAKPGRVSVPLMAMRAPVQPSAASVRMDQPRVWKA
jgi:hypothetical protein